MGLLVETVTSFWRLLISIIISKVLLGSFNMKKLRVDVS